MSSEFRRWLGLIFVLIPGFAAFAQTNGIFADFTTSMGSFTCQLDYTNAPKAVANFVGLATGQRAWLDLVTGEVRTNAFYNGITFHRVISNFMDQGGSPNGIGTDGPGYAVVDEFTPSLTFNNPWVLAMANSGPDSNGSQFFVTVAPFTSGNNTYTIFGHVTSGTNVVASINHVATDSNDKPLTNVIIQQVAIRRVGIAAQAFNINAQGLPLVTNTPLLLAEGSGKVSMTFSNRLYAHNRWYSSTNLSSWAENDLGIETSAPSSNSVQSAMDSPQKFFRFAQVQYASSTLAPKDVHGRTLVLILVYSGGQATNTITFDNAGGGAYILSGSPPGTVTSYSWSQAPYRGLLWPIYYSAPVYPMTLQLNFSTSTNGSISGTVYSAPSFQVSGTFKLSSP